jgi:hypothetical protein
MLTAWLRKGGASSAADGAAAASSSDIVESDGRKRPAEVDTGDDAAVAVGTCATASASLSATATTSTHQRRALAHNQPGLADGAYGCLFWLTPSFYLLAFFVALVWSAVI